jgi:hypothetical protein
MFDIAFYSDPPEPQEDGWVALRGRTLLGEHSEDFLASLAVWTPEDYQRHWHEAATRLVAGSPSAFITSAFQFRWLMWPRPDGIAVHEQLLLEGHGFKEHDAFSGIPPYSAQTDEGEVISEWLLSPEDVAGYLRRIGDSRRS